MRHPPIESAWVLPHLGVAAWLLQSALGQPALVGVDTGEAWGRAFVTAQVGRWVGGQSPWGVADLLHFPGGQPFWPVDPAVQILAVPLSLLFGDLRGLALVAMLLSALAGIGPHRLARTLGADRAGALAAGLLVQLSPYLLRNLHDCVLEVVAVGICALAIEAIVHAHRQPGRRPLLWAGGMIGLVAATSPYLAVYLAVGSALAILGTLRAWRRWLGIGAAGALACGLVALPLLLTEHGEHGRLGPSYRGSGYHLVPEPLVNLADGQRSPPLPPPPLAAPPPGAPSAGPGTGGPPPPQRGWERLLRRIPGGAVLSLGGLLALAASRSRRWALLGLALLLLGPGPGLILRALGRPGEAAGPLQLLLEALPLTASLGNPTRLLLAWVLLAAVGAGLFFRGPWAGLLAAGALAEALVTVPGGVLPATPVPAAPTVLAALEGPTVIFPSGDPPWWYPFVAPKEILFLAGRAGVPVAYDYGRGQVPEDLGAVLALSEGAGLPVGRSAWQLDQEGHPRRALDEGGFTHLLVLDGRLPTEARKALWSWLEGRARLLAEEDGLSAWEIGP